MELARARLEHQISPDTGPGWVAPLASELAERTRAELRSFEASTTCTAEHEQVAPSMSKIHVFVSFDIEHDRELYELLLAQSQAPSSDFAVLGGSERATATDVWSERVRRRIGEADQVIVICGEHTKLSTPVSAELRIAQEERTPYHLLWGRREIMCTRPIGAKPADAMYSWTRQILQDRITLTLRKSRADAMAEPVRDAARKG
jgi:hypothetical protein